MPARMFVRVRGDRELRAYLARDPFPLPMLAREIGVVTAKVRKKAQDRAPGSLASAVTSDVSTKGKAVTGRIMVADRENPRDGFRYPWALDKSKKRRYRRRSGSMKGRLTRGWFTNSKSGASKELKARLTALAVRLVHERTAGML